MEALHWYLFSTSFVSTWCRSELQVDQSEAVRRDCLDSLAQLGCGATEAETQLNSLEQCFAAYFEGLSEPPSGALEGLRYAFGRGRKQLSRQ